MHTQTHTHTYTHTHIYIFAPKEDLYDVTKMYSAWDKSNRLALAKQLELDQVGCPHCSCWRHLCLLFISSTCSS